MTDEKDPRNNRYYHGGDGGLKIGNYILPPNSDSLACYSEASK